MPNLTKKIICNRCRGSGCAKYELFHPGDMGQLSWTEYYTGTCCDCEGTGILEIPMSKADCIRDMSDVELASFLTEVGLRKSFWGRTKFRTISEALEWLRRPVQNKNLLFKE